MGPESGKDTSIGGKSFQWRDLSEGTWQASRESGNLQALKERSRMAKPRNGWECLTRRGDNSH